MISDAALLANLRTMTYFARKLVRGTSCDPDDLVQTACVYALQSKSDATHFAKPASWLRSCVKIAWYNQCRIDGRYVAGGDEIAAAEAVDGAQEASTDLRSVIDALDALPKKQRDAIIVMNVDGMHAREAAAHLGYADHRSPLYHHHRGMATLRARLAA